MEPTSPSFQHFNTIKTAYDNGQTNLLPALIDDAFSDPNAKETELAHVCGLIYELRRRVFGPEYASAFRRFIERFPDSVYPPEALYADLLVSLDAPGATDLASTHAREYFARIFQHPERERILKSPIQLHAFGSTFLVMTAVYTQVGARSYAKRLIEFLRPIDKAYWNRTWLDGEIARLDDELKSKDHADTDAIWEAFFSTGTDLKRCLKICEWWGAKNLAKRLVLIEANFRFNADYRLNEGEFTQLVRYTDSGEALLL